MGYFWKYITDYTFTAPHHSLDGLSWQSNLLLLFLAASFCIYLYRDLGTSYFLDLESNEIEPWKKHL